MGSTEEFTTREREILELIGEGRSTKDVAKKLGLSVWTVANYRKRLCAKLGAQASAELVALCAAAGREWEAAGEAWGLGCGLALELRTDDFRIQITYRGRLRRGPAAARVRIGRKTYRF